MGIIKEIEKALPYLCPKCLYTDDTKTPECPVGEDCEKFQQENEFTICKTCKGRGLHKK